MVRLLCVALCVFVGTIAQSSESSQKQVNHCKKAVNKETGYRVSGIYGSSLESEKHTSAVYVLLSEIKKLKVLQREFQQKTEKWRFEFAEMIGGKTVVFVYHRQVQIDFCAGSNTFFVLKK